MGDGVTPCLGNANPLQSVATRAMVHRMSYPEQEHSNSHSSLPKPLGFTDPLLDALQRVRPYEGAQTAQDPLEIEMYPKN